MFMMMVMMMMMMMMMMMAGIDPNVKIGGWKYLCMQVCTFGV